MPKNIAVLLYPGCVFGEIAHCVERLSQCCEVRYFTPQGDGAFRLSNQLMIQPDGSYSGILPWADAIVIPGGNPDSILNDGLSDEILRKAHEEGRILAGICAGVMVMAHAGVLQGRKATHLYQTPMLSEEIAGFVAPWFQETTSVLKNFCVDGNCVTAMPWATVEFSSALEASLGLQKKLPVHEIWDVLDASGEKTGETWQRGIPMPEGLYHRVVHIWLQNEAGDYLVQKRADHLSWLPGLWATTGGSIVSGEDSLTGAIRELEEEMGLSVPPQSLVLLKRFVKSDYSPDTTFDLWYAGIDAKAVARCQAGLEVSQVAFKSREEILAMVKAGQFVDYGYFEFLPEKI